MNYNAVQELQPEESLSCRMTQEPVTHVERPSAMATPLNKIK